MNNEIKVSLSVVLQGRTMLSQEVIQVKTRKSAPASQSLNISKEGYDAMTDKKNVPYWSKAGTWAGMNAKMRLEAHLRRICEGLGGTSYTYQVFED